MAAPSYPVGLPAGAADSVGSPPPTSTTSPGREPATSLVVSRWSGSVTDSSATEVASLAVDAGVTELAAPRSSSTCPVSASSTVAETRVPSRSVGERAGQLAGDAGGGLRQAGRRRGEHRGRA